MSVYKTTDIILAACLRVNGHALSTIDHQGKMGIFVFDDVPDSFITEYDLGKVKVEPVIFNNTIKQLATSVRRLVDGS